MGAYETEARVILEEGKAPENKSYMWVYRGYDEHRKILLFDYKPDRKGINPNEYLDGYQGYLQTDGYDGYNLTVKAQKVIHLACRAFAFVRRCCEKEVFQLLQGIEEKQLSGARDNP